MKIGVAQTRPVTGDISQNIGQHKKFIALAASQGAGILIFPELSLTGYEPTLASALAIYPDDDSRLNLFQELSDAHGMKIGVGVPTRWEEGVCISLVLFQPQEARRLYSKRYLHADEEPFFISGQNAAKIIGEDIALAICYEIYVLQHAEDAFGAGARIYIASVAKFTHGIDKALERLAEIARTYSMTVLLSNSVGPADGLVCAGKSSVWNNKGDVMGQLDDDREGILIFDTDMHTTTKAFFGQV